jgi:hypothetical protein
MSHFFPISRDRRYPSLRTSIANCPFEVGNDPKRQQKAGFVCVPAPKEFLFILAVSIYTSPLHLVAFIEAIPAASYPPLKVIDENLIRDLFVSKGFCLLYILLPVVLLLSPKVHLKKEKG